MNDSVNAPSELARARELAGTYTVAALETLRRIMDDDRAAGEARLEAALALLNLANDDEANGHELPPPVELGPRDYRITIEERGPDQTWALVSTGEFGEQLFETFTLVMKSLAQAMIAGIMTPGRVCRFAAELIGLDYDRYARRPFSERAAILFAMGGGDVPGPAEKAH